MRPSAGNNEDFYGRIPVFHGFARLMDPALYAPLPEDWIVGVADIVDSTRAIADQRYKAVNMAGAAVIAAVTNALQGREFPFVFGGDGASFAVAPGDLAHARGAERGITVRIPPLKYCTDNGAMIAALGSAVVARGVEPSGLGIGVDSSMPLERITA